MSENTGSNNDTAVATRNVVSFKDLSMAYLMNGLDGLREKCASVQVSKATHNRALAFLRASNKDTAAYEGYVTSLFGSAEPGSRGRSAPQVGDVRHYKTQKVDRTGPFIRLPLETLGLGKGSVAKVEYLDGKIVVTPAPNATADLVDSLDADEVVHGALVILGGDGTQDVKLSREPAAE